LKFDPVDWKDISSDAKDLVSKMLDKDPSTRITASMCLDDAWFKI
jgi:serine/threonine protein kinase